MNILVDCPRLIGSILNYQRKQKINDLINGRITLTVAWAKKIGAALNVSYKNFV